MLKSKVYKKILVTATMSAGKSTLVNALIGKKIMTTQNESSTAKKYFIKEDVNCGEGVYGFHNNVRVRLKEDNAQVLYNFKQDKVVIHSGMNHVEDLFLWEIIDTPGVNSSMNPEHNKITESLISRGDFDVLLYVMNANHLGVNDDRKHLSFIKDNVGIEKIIFVVNKIDQFRRNHDSVEQSIKNIRTYLKDIGFINPVIQPISAYMGYLSKLYNSGQYLNEDEQDEIELLTKKLSNSYFNLAKYNLISTDGYDENQERLSRCGLYNLELLICRRDI